MAAQAAKPRKVEFVVAFRVATLPTSAGPKPV